MGCLLGEDDGCLVGGGLGSISSTSCVVPPALLDKDTPPELVPMLLPGVIKMEFAIVSVVPSEGLRSTVMGLGVGNFTGAQYAGDFVGLTVTGPDVGDTMVPSAMEFDVICFSSVSR